jgi:phage terminase large subunit
LTEVVIPTARVFQPLLEPARTKGAYGGRGSGKSWFFSGLAVEDALRWPGDAGEGLRFVAVREVQKTLEQSAKALVEKTLLQHGLTERDGFKVHKDRIQLPGDGVMVFQGMQDHTAESIKSLEGFHRAWVEEAQTLSATSLRLLRPTIRWEDEGRGLSSEIWTSWNPRRKIDPIDVLLRQGQAPTNSVVVRANWSDNPWFPKVLDQERLDCLRDTPDEYDHIWEGGYVTVTEGAYYAKQIAKAKAERRIGFHVAQDPFLPVRLVADIGGTGAKSDAFVFWAVQFVGQEIRWLNYYEAQGQEIGHHLAWAAKEGYGPGEAIIVLPHDGETNDRVYAVSYESAFRKAGYEVEVVPNQGRGAAMARIDQGRRLFPQMWFDVKCEPGVEALGWYHEKRSKDDRNIGLGPEHDWSSHGADAFGLGAVVYKTPEPEFKGIDFAGL